METTELGKYIEQLRRSKQMSREAFCEIGDCLTPRQLIRIEKGKSTPGLDKLSYIANRLDIPLYTLMPDYKTLDPDYLKLKYLILRTAVYAQEEVLEQIETHFDTIFDVYYDDLPQEEQEIVTILQAIHEVNRTSEPTYGEAVLEDYLPGVLEQHCYSFRDLLVIRLYFLSLCEQVPYQVKLPQDMALVNQMFERVIAVESLALEELFVQRDLIFSALAVKELMADFDGFRSAIDKLDDIMVKTKDFQKKPLLLMVSWKYCLACQENFIEANRLYQESRLLASMLGEAVLAERLDWQWQEDLKKYLSHPKV